VPDAPGRYAFAHALIRQTLYEEIGTTRRARLHWRIGEAIEGRFAAVLEPHLSALAYHFAEGAVAGDPLRSVEVSLRAGEHAAALVAHEEALGHFRRALTTLDQAGLDDPERRYRAYMGCGHAHIALGEGDPFRKAFGDAAALARSLGWAERQARALFLATSIFQIGDETAQRDQLVRVEEGLAALGPGDRAERALLLARRAWIVDLAGSAEEGLSLAAEALAIARRLGDPETLAEALHVRGFLLLGSPHLDEREAINRELIELAPRALRNLNRLALARRGSMITAAARGDRSALERALQEGERDADAARSRGGRAHVAFWRGALALAEGRIDEAKRLAASVRDLARGERGYQLAYQGAVLAARLEQGRLAQAAQELAEFVAAAPPGLQLYRVVRASVLADLGRLDEGHRELQELSRRGRRLVDASWGAQLALRHAAEWCALAGDRERAAELARVAEPFAGQLLIPFSGYLIESSADRARGQLAATFGRLDEAIERYESGLALEQSFGALALAARTRYWLARALVERGAPGDAERARTEAVASQESAYRFGMARLEERARELTAQLG